MILNTEMQAVLADCLLDMGVLLIDAGAEISRVEDTLSRMAYAYGAKRADVFALTNYLSATLEFEGGAPLTETRRIMQSGGTDLFRIEKLNELSRECCAAPFSPEDLRARVDKISSGKKPFSFVLGGSILAAGAFAVFFGGSVWDGLAAAALGAMIAVLGERLSRTQVSTVVSDLLLSLITGLCAGLLCHFIPVLLMDKIIIGDIMLLIPGLAMTNAVRNILSGNTISGFIRLCESLIWTGAIAGGFMLALIFTGLLF